MFYPIEVDVKSISTITLINEYQDLNNLYYLKNPIITININESNLFICHEDEYFSNDECKKIQNIINIYLTP